MKYIKFKGKTSAGEWIFGNLAILTKNYQKIDPGTYISNSAGIPFAYRVIPETVCQFSGLRDMNNVEIYEGDYVLKFNKFTSTIIFKNGAYGYCPDKYSDFIPLGHNYHFNWTDGMSYKIKVVGNIHDD